MSPRVSVCMATYNGAQFIEEQLASILAEIGADDEVVIVDDASTDDTVDRVRAIADPRIRLHLEAENSGYVRTFERAILRAEGEILMLSDQDDIWIPGRRELLLEALSSASVVASNLVLLGTDEPLPSPVTRRRWVLRSSQSRQRLRNEVRILAGVAPYFGCAMAFRRDCRDRILPFPPFLVEGHDLWIATVANDSAWMTHLDVATIRRRIHDSNASPTRPRSLRLVLAGRWMLVRAWREAVRRRRSRDDAGG